MRTWKEDMKSFMFYVPGGSRWYSYPLSLLVFPTGIARSLEYCPVSSRGKVMSYRLFSDASSWRCRRLRACRAASRHGRAIFFSLPCETLASCPSTASSECKCWCWEEEEKQSKGEEEGKMNRKLTQDGKRLLLLMLELTSAMSKLLQNRYKRIFKEKMKHFGE